MNNWIPYSASAIAKMDYATLSPILICAKWNLKRIREYIATRNLTIEESMSLALDKRDLEEYVELLEERENVLAEPAERLIKILMRQCI